MSSDETTEQIFQEVENNRYINDGEISSTVIDEYNVERDRFGNIIRRSNPFRYQSSRSNAAYDSIGSIHTSSSHETHRYLQRWGTDVYQDCNPEIIHDGTTEIPVTYSQRVSLRCLQPPPIPPPEPNIIIEKRPEQPPPPPPLVIYEHDEPPRSSPPIILRERPPVPPPRVPGETKIHWLEPIPVPPRSLEIHRFPAQEKPPDIIMERWLPYGPPPERRTIIKRAPPAMKYPQPTHTVVIHDKAPVRVVQKFEHLGVTQENPDAYVCRYGSSLLDSQTFVQEARNAGVTENINCPCPSASTSTTTNEHYNICQSNEIINQDCCSCQATRRCSCRGTRYRSYQEPSRCSYEGTRRCSYQEPCRCSCQGIYRCHRS